MPSHPPVHPQLFWGWMRACMQHPGSTGLLFGSSHVDEARQVGTSLSNNWLTAYAASPANLHAACNPKTFFLSGCTLVRGSDLVGFGTCMIITSPERICQEGSERDSLPGLHSVDNCIALPTGLWNRMMMMMHLLPTADCWAETWNALAEPWLHSWVSFGWRLLGNSNNRVCEKIMTREGWGIQIRQMVPCGWRM